MKNRHGIYIRMINKASTIINKFPTIFKGIRIILFHLFSVMSVSGVIKLFTRGSRIEHW